MDDNSFLEINQLSVEYDRIACSIETLESLVDMLSTTLESFDNTDLLTIGPIKDTLSSYVDIEEFGNISSMEDIRSAIDRLIELIRSARRRLSEILSDILERIKSGSAIIGNQIKNIQLAVSDLEKKNPPSDGRRIKVSSAGRLHIGGAVEPAGVLSALRGIMSTFNNLKVDYINGQTAVLDIVDGYYKQLSSSGKLPEAKLTEHARHIAKWTDDLNKRIANYDNSLFNKPLPGGQMLVKRDLTVMQGIVTFVPAFEHHATYNDVNTSNDFVLPSVRDLRSIVNALDSYHVRFEKDRSAIHGIVTKNRSIDRSIETASRRVKSGNSESYTQLRPHATLDGEGLMRAINLMMTHQSTYMRSLIAYLRSAIAKYNQPK